MPIHAPLLSELDHEAAVTRRCIERAPDARLAWKPHPKSFSLGGLVTHLCGVMRWGLFVLEKDELDLEPGGNPLPRLQEVRSVADALASFDRLRAELRATLAAADDARLTGTWTLKKNGAVVLALPRVAALRGFVFNHSLHHRGQLTVYLRMLDVPVPATYGPSADESPA